MHVLLQLPDLDVLQENHGGSVGWRAVVPHQYHAIHPYIQRRICGRCRRMEESSYGELHRKGT